MRTAPPSTTAYLTSLPENRREAISALCAVFREHLPSGFEESFAYKMVSFCVPHVLYPAGYHCDPNMPLPFVQIASQAKHVAVYHMGLYAMPTELTWFQRAWALSIQGKLDMGKSCIRLNPHKPLPLQLLAELAQRVTVENWIEVYETAFSPRKGKSAPKR